MRALFVVGTMAVSFATIASLVATNADAARHRPAQPAIQGAWELVWPQPAAHTREIKLITAHHFTWTTFDTENLRPLSSGGGACLLDGTRYQENLWFASGSAESIAGTVQRFTVRVKGDSLYQEGGTTEVWRRLR